MLLEDERACYKLKVTTVYVYMCLYACIYAFYKPPFFSIPLLYPHISL